ncbi:MAG: hypothetical protein IT581_12235 [Verrucomicrobiales bacterium]|nr:hypothetical protein [Verrucomicrobiales bacterium]
MLREEGVLMLAFDAAKTIEEKLKILDGLLRVRRMMLDVLGWPKPPTMRGNFMPQAVDGERNHDPMSDIEVPAMIPAAPSEPASGAE